MGWARASTAAGGALALAGLALGVARVVAHETGELEHRAGPMRIADRQRDDPHRTEQTVRLTEVRLAKGDRVLVELCAASPAPDGAWERSLHAVAWMPDDDALLFRTPITRRLGVRRRGARRCWTVGIGTVPRSGTVAIEAFWPGPAPSPEVAAAALDVRVAAYALPGGLDRVAVALLGLGVLLMVAAGGRWMQTWPDSARKTTDAEATGGVTTALVAIALLVAAELASGILSGGAVGLLASGSALALAQIAIAVALSRRAGPPTPLDRLGLRAAPRFGAWWALAVGALAGAVALLVPGLWPPRGLAPLEAAIAWPSGKLAVAVVALLVPAAEELFFRGLVFGALRPRLGNAGAVIGASILFLLAHVPQDLGNPGALVAVGITGVLLGALRAASGSVWPCVLAHVLYNTALVSIAWW